MRAPGGIASLALGVWASTVFVVLWFGAVIGLAGGGTLFEQAWAWVGGLGIAGAVIVWILFLPVCVGLWVTQSSLPMPAAVLVVALLVAWTALAWGSLARTMLMRR